MEATVVAYGVFLALLGAAAWIDVRTLRIPNALVVGLVGVWALWRAALVLAGALALGGEGAAGGEGPSGVAGLAAAVVAEPVALCGGFPPAASAADGLVGALVLGGGLLTVTLGYEALSGRRAMGGGDVKLMAAAGLFLGVEGGLVCLLTACVASLAMALVLPRLGWRAPSPGDFGEVAQGASPDGPSVGTAGRERRLGAVPFGPGIALGALVAVLLAAFA